MWTREVANSVKESLPIRPILLGSVSELAHTMIQDVGLHRGR